MRATFRRSTGSFRPTPTNEKLSQTSYSPSWRVAEVRPLSSKLLIDVRQFHPCIQVAFSLPCVIASTHVRNVDEIPAISPYLPHLGPVPLVTLTSYGVNLHRVPQPSILYPTTLSFCLRVALTPALGADEAPDPAEGLDPKVVEVYTKYVLRFVSLWEREKKGKAGSTYNIARVGQLLRSYRAGPLPKPFKIIPSLPAWARILALTAPEQWSPQAAHAATRIFISNMKPPQARVFLEGVVLGLVRADLEQPSTRKDTRKLSPHLYEALKRALYKPAAFFKGIVFPLLDVSTRSDLSLPLVLSLDIWALRWA